jgi:L-alanine-DL-glutamate epimerase-like enolase superfamily enzyme
VKITAVETLCLSRLHEPERQWVTSKYRTIKADCAIVVITTDEGLTGIGEAGAYGWPRMIESWVGWLAPTLIGRDPNDLAIVPHPAQYTERPYDCAVAGIDCALWDLRGKIAGKRVAELLTPRPLDRVRVYASSGCRYDWRVRPEQLIEEALGYIADGFTAYKFRIGTEWAWDGVTTDRFLGLVRDLASAVDGRMELMLDGNQRLTEEQALTIARELDRLGFTWFEEPIPQLDIDAYARLNRAVDLPITGGEQFTSLHEFRPYIERGAYGIVQPDAGICGITETFAIAEMADRYGIPCCPHSWHNGLMAMANGHVVAALPNPHVLEVCQIQGPLQWAILDNPPPITDGHLALPDAPGLGVALAADLEGRFPYIEGHYAITVERYPAVAGPPRRA